MVIFILNEFEVVFRLVPSLLLKLRLQFKTLDSFIIKDGNMQAKEQSFAASQRSKIRKKVPYFVTALFATLEVIFCIFFFNQIIFTRKKSFKK